MLTTQKQFSLCCKLTLLCDLYINMKNLLVLNHLLISLPFSLPAVVVSAVYRAKSHRPWNVLLFHTGWRSPLHVEGTRCLHCLRAAQVPGQVWESESWPGDLPTPMTICKDNVWTKTVWGFGLPLFRLYPSMPLVCKIMGERWCPLGSAHPLCRSMGYPVRHEAPVPQAAKGRQAMG